MATTYTKQPAESKEYAIDFVNLLAAGDALASVTSVTGTPTGLTITDEAIAGTQVTFTVAGGTDGVTYTVEAVAVTTGGETLEGDGYLDVADLPVASAVPTGYTRNVLTFQDCYERAVNWLGAFGHDVGTLTTGPPELLKGAIADAYETILNAYAWPCLEGYARIHVHAAETTGTVSYTNSTRRMTLTGSTWPTWAAGASVRVDDKVHRIATRNSTTVVTLDEYLNPGEDLTDETYSLFRMWYDLPRDFQFLKRLFTEERGQLQKIPLTTLQRLYREDYGTSYAQRFTLGGHPWLPGRQVLYVWPPSEADETIDYTYGRRPRDLRFSGYDTNDSVGTVTLTAGSMVVTGSSTVFTDEMEGAMLRVARSTTRPTGTHGNARYAEQYPIHSVTSATQLVLASTPTASRSAVAYVVTDPLTLDYSAYAAVLRQVEYLLALAFRSEYVGTCRKEALEALRLAAQGCASHMPDTPQYVAWDPFDGTVDTGV